MTVRSAGQVVWDGGTSGAGSSWSSAANWNPDGVPSAGADILFNSRNGSGTLPSALSVSGDRTLGLITFDNINSVLPATLNIDTNGSGSTARTLTINSGITLRNTSTTVAFRGSNGTLSVVLGGANTFAVSSGALLQISSGVVISGAYGITTVGLGTVNLNGPNTFSGGVTVGSGSTLRLGTATASSAAGSTVSGGVLVSGQAGTGLLRLQNGATLLSTGSGSRTMQNSLALNGNVTLGAASTFTGALIFNSASGTEPGETLAAPATVVLESAVVLTNPVPVTFANAVGGAFSLTKQGAGTLLLSGANTYSGGTSVDQGALIFAKAAARPALGSVSVAGGAALGLGVGGAEGFSSADLDDLFAGAWGTGLAAGSTLNLETSAAGFVYGQGIPAMSLNLVKSGQGTLLLTGASAHAGSTTISGGVLDVGIVTGPALNGGPLYFSGSGVLQGEGLLTRNFSGTATAADGQISGSSGGFAARGGPLIVNLGGAGAAILLSSGNFRFGDNFVLGSPTADSPVIVLNPVSTNGTFTRTFTVPAGLGGDYAELAGALTSTGNIVKAGDGLLVLTGGNTVSGSLTVNAGTVQLGGAANGGTTGAVPFSNIVNNGTLVFSRTNALAYAGEISGSGTLVQAGSGTTTLSGANSYGGATTVRAGTLRLEYSADSSMLSNAAPLNLEGGVLELAGPSGHEEVVNGLTLSGGARIVRGGGSSTLVLGLITRSGTGAVDFSISSLAKTSTLNDSTGILGPWATVGGTDFAANSINATDGPITAFSGYTSVNRLGGVIADDAGGNQQIVNGGVSGAVTLAAAGATQIHTLKMGASEGPATVAFSAGQSLRFGATGAILAASGAQTLTVGSSPGNGSLTAGGTPDTPGDLILTSYSSEGLTVNSAIVNNGSGAVRVIVTGTGTTTLAGSNTFTGGLFLEGGTLRFSTSAALGPVTAPASPRLFLRAGTLVADTAGGSISSSVNRILEIGPAGGYGEVEFKILGDNQLTLSGAIRDTPGGSGRIVKTGPGILRMQDTASTFTGGVSVLEGTLSIGNETRLGTAPAVATPGHLLLDGGTLLITGSLTLNPNRGISLGADADMAPVLASGNVSSLSFS